MGNLNEYELMWIIGSSDEDELSEKLNNNIKITTYQDHRMALSFAPLAVIIDISIESPNVVSKSFPDYWEDLKILGFKIN